MIYTLSYYRPVIRTVVRHPQRWRFWKRAQVTHEKQMERVVIYDVPQRTADFLIADNSSLLDLVPDATQVQLEHGQQPTSYIKTIAQRDYAVEDGFLEEWTK
jgi:hypothetical protein